MVDSNDSADNEIDLKLLKLSEQTGYEISQQNAQRILGPPAVWNRPIPIKNSEVFVGKIPKDCYEDELYPFFSEVGPVYMIRLMMDHNQLNKGYGFVTYPDFETAQKAVLLLDKREIRPGMKLVVMLSTNHCRLLLHNLNLPLAASDYLKEEILGCDVTGLTSVEIRPYENSHNQYNYARLEFSSHRDAALARRKLLPECQGKWGKDAHLQWAPIELADFPQHNKLRYNQHWNKHISLYNKDTKRNSGHNNHHSSTATRNNSNSTFPSQLCQQLANTKKGRRISPSDFKNLQNYLPLFNGVQKNNFGTSHKLNGLHESPNSHQRAPSRPSLNHSTPNPNSQINHRALANLNGILNSPNYTGNYNCAQNYSASNYSGVPNYSPASVQSYNNGTNYNGTALNYNGTALNYNATSNFINNASNYSTPSNYTAPDYSGASNYNASSYLGVMNGGSYPSLYTDPEYFNTGRRSSNTDQIELLTRHLSRMSFSPNNSMTSDDFTFDYDPKDFNNPRLLNYTPRQSPVQDNQLYRTLGLTNGAARDLDQSYFSAPENSLDAFRAADLDFGSNVFSSPGSGSLGAKSLPNSPLRVLSSPREPNSLESPNSSVTSPYDSSRQEKDSQRLINQGSIHPAPPDLQCGNFEDFNSRDLLPDNRNAGVLGMNISHWYGNGGDYDLQMNLKGVKKPLTKTNLHLRSYKRGIGQWR